MKCPNCGGKGKFKNGFGKIGVCYYCLGTGKVNNKGERNMTNEEWFCNLSIKEKAKWLEDKMTWAAQEQGTFTAKGWEMWLKQPHTVKE